MLPLAEITNSTLVSVPVEVLVGSLAGIVTALVAIGVAVAKGVWYLRGILEEISQLKTSVQASWTRQEHERWAHRLERENLEIGLRVPPIETESNH